MKQLFWNKLPNNVIPKTIWMGITEADPIFKTDELEDLFSKAQSAATPVLTEGAAEEGIARKKVISILDMSRSQNVSIALAGLKLSGPDIRSAILKCDEQVLTVDNLRALSGIVPTDDEVKDMVPFEQSSH